MDIDIFILSKKGGWVKIIFLKSKLHKMDDRITECILSCLPTLTWDKALEGYV